MLIEVMPKACASVRIFARLPRVWLRHIMGRPMQQIMAAPVSGWIPERSKTDYYDIMILGRKGMGKSTTADKLILADSNTEFKRDIHYSHDLWR